MLAIIAHKCQEMFAVKLKKGGDCHKLRLINIGRKACQGILNVITSKNNHW